MGRLQIYLHEWLNFMVNEYNIIYSNLPYMDPMGFWDDLFENRATKNIDTEYLLGGKLLPTKKKHQHTVFLTYLFPILQRIVSHGILVPNAFLTFVQLDVCTADPSARAWGCLSSQK